MPAADGFSASTDDHLIAFRYGFLKRCAELGLSAAEAEDLAERYLEHQEQSASSGLVKQANPAGLLTETWALEKALGLGQTGFGKAFGWTEQLTPWALTSLVIPAALLVGPVAGLSGAGAVHALRNVEEESDREVQMRELIRAYRRGIQQLDERAGNLDQIAL